MTSSSIKPSIKSLIPPLWVWLTFGVWAAVLFIMNVVWGTPLRTGYLADSDDYLRMSRVFDLLDHKNYPSWQQPRLGPGGMVENGWSRLIDGPLWLLMTMFEAFMPRAQAALWTVTVFPALALLTFIFGAVWYTRSLVSGTNGLSTCVALLATCLMWDALHQFMPGRVTHHDWQIVLTVAAYACVLRLCLFPQEIRWPVLGGIFFGTGLGIGADIVPWFVLGTALIGFHWLVYGDKYEHAALRFGTAATLTTAAWFIVLVSPDRFLKPECDTISPTFLSFAAAVGAFWYAVSLLPVKWKAALDTRAVAAAVIAGLIGICIYRLSPNCFHDIYGLTDPLVREAWLHRVIEARPVLFVAQDKPLFAIFMLGPVVVGILGAAWAAKVERDRSVTWIGLALVLTLGSALTFWQFRTLDYVQAIGIAPLAWMIMALASKTAQLARRMTPRRRLAAEILFFLLCAVSFTSQISSHKAAPKSSYQRMREKCSIRDAAPALNTLQAPQMIAAYVDEGAEIIYRTDHWALAGPYHRDQEGIGAVYRLFTAPDAKAAHALIDKYKIGVVLVCPPQRSFWDSIAPQKTHFARELLDGHIPSWLSRVPSEGAIQIYRVRK